MNSLCRHTRHNPSLCVTCAGQTYRHKRHTPLEGVTTVTLTELVPMPPFQGMGGTDDGTLSFSLPKIRGKDHG